MLPAENKTIYMKRILYLITLLISFVCQSQEYKYKHYDVTSGLSNNKINAIYKDTRGFVWIGTASGLNRYDGHEFKVYRSQKDDANTPSDNYIESIQEFDNGDLLVKSGSAYIRYDRRRDAFVRHIDYIDSLQQPQNVYIDKSKNLWYYDRYNGVSVRMKGDNKFRRVTDSSKSLTTNDVTDIRQVGSEMVFVNDKGELIFVDAHKCAVVRRVETKDRANAVGRVNTAYCDKNNRLWIYNLDLLTVYDADTHRVATDLLGKFDNASVIRAVTQDATGKIWLGYDHKGLAIIDPVTAVAVKLSDDEALKNITISALYTDDDGTVWVGTYKKGLYQYNAQSFKFGMREFPDVNCVAGRSDEAVWIGTDSGLLLKWNRRTNETESYSDPASQSRDNAIVCLCTTDNVGVWVGTYRDGLKYFANGKFTRFGMVQGLIHENVWSIVDAGDGKLWVATLGGGLQLFDTRTCRFETYNTRNTKLINDYINTICKGSDGKLYIGTTQGLSVMDLSTREITNTFGSHDGVKSFVNPGIVQLYEDSRRLLWIATSEGLYVYDRSRDNLQQVKDKAEYPDQFILGLVEDNQGSMWVSIGASLSKVIVSRTASGIYDFVCSKYAQNDGVQNSDFNQRSFHRLPGGDILVGGLYGVNTFNPQQITYSSKSPNVMFTGLSIQNQYVNVGEEYDGCTVLPSELNSDDVVNIDYKHNDFTIYFSSDNYIDPEETQFYYRLVGFNSEWIKCAPNMHQATYTNLPYGEYVLEVKAVNNDGTSSVKPSKLKIVVHPPFWLTVWAKMLYVVIGLVVLFLIFRLMKRYEHKLYQEQQREEAIKQQEELTQMKFRFFTNISHELRTPLTLILSPLEAMLKDTKDDKQHRRLEIIRGNANKLLYLVNQLLDFRKNEIAGLKFRPDEGDIVAYIKNLCESFDGFLESKKVQLTFFSSSDTLMMSFDPDKMGKIVLNLLSNAFKFTPDGGRVDVALSQNEGKLIIKVSDTGVGIDDKDKPLIFQRFYQSDSNKSGGSGIGLSLVNEYVKLHDGTAEVVDNVGGGSVFIITLPIRHIALPAEDIAAKNIESVEKQANNDRALVLIADDNKDLLTFLSEEISSKYNVVTATNGREALEVVEQNMPDIIVTDLMMPVMDGIELCRQLKSDKKYSPIPIIVLSAKQDDRAKVEGLTIGADDYITKPFNCDVLMLRIGKLIELSRKGVQRSLIEPEPTPIKVTSLDEKLIEAAVKYVEENMERTDLSVEELSRHLGMSRVHLYKRMRQVTGKTPIEFIRVLRLKRAAQLLRESQLNVSEIAYQVGFNNPKYFSTYFKQEFGVLPSVYQEKEGK